MFLILLEVLFKKYRGVHSLSLRMFKVRWFFDCVVFDQRLYLDSGVARIMRVGRLENLVTNRWCNDEYGILHTVSINQERKKLCLLNGHKQRSLNDFIIESHSHALYVFANKFPAGTAFKCFWGGWSLKNKGSLRHCTSIPSIWRLIQIKQFLHDWLG